MVGTLVSTSVPVKLENVDPKGMECNWHIKCQLQHRPWGLEMRSRRRHDKTNFAGGISTGQWQEMVKNGMKRFGKHTLVQKCAEVMKGMIQIGATPTPAFGFSDWKKNQCHVSTATHFTATTCHSKWIHTPSMLWFWQGEFPQRFNLHLHRCIFAAVNMSGPDAKKTKPAGVLTSSKRRFVDGRWSVGHSWDTDPEWSPPSNPAAKFVLLHWKQGKLCH